MSALPQKDTLKRSAMASGRFLDPWNVRPEDIFIEDIARGLANVNRYNGQFGPYSVAQHSIYVAWTLPRALMLAGLLHDAPEYITGDLAHHIKYGAGILGLEWKRLDAPIARAIEKRFGLWDHELDSEVIKLADERVFDSEWASFVTDGGTGVIEVWPWERAEAEFLRVYNEVR